MFAEKIWIRKLTERNTSAHNSRDRIMDYRKEYKRWMAGVQDLELLDKLQNIDDRAIEDAFANAKHFLHPRGGKYTLPPTKKKVAV